MSNVIIFVISIKCFAVQDFYVDSRICYEPTAMMYPPENTSNEKKMIYPLGTH